MISKSSQRLQAALVRAAVAAPPVAAEQVAANASNLKIPLERTKFASGAADANFDIRKACNVIKRFSSLSIAINGTDIAGTDIYELAENVALKVLTDLKFNIDDKQRMDGVFPMVMEVSCDYLAGVSKASGQKPTLESLQAIAKSSIPYLSSLAKSRTITKSLEIHWKSEIDSLTALRIVLYTSMAKMLAPLSKWDYQHTQEQCIFEISKAVMKIASDDFNKVMPNVSMANSNARVMLMRTLITRTADHYALALEHDAQRHMTAHDQLTAQESNESLDAMKDVPMSNLLAAVTLQVQEQLSAVLKSCLNNVDFQKIVELTAAPAKVVAMTKPSMKL